MELTIDQALQQGIEAHKVGQVQEADRLYTAILKAQPKHPDANHNMGVLAVGVDKVQEALPFFKTALEANPNTAQFWLSYIDALIKLEKIAEAKAVLDQAKSKGAKGDGFNKLEQKLTEKPAAITTSKHEDPPQDQLQPLLNLYSQGQLQQALEEASQLLKQFPTSLTLYNIQGAANVGLDQFDVAVEAFKKLIEIKPDYAWAHNNLGFSLQKTDRLEEAIEAYKKGIEIEQNSYEACYNMGNALKDLGRLEEAIVAYNRALSIKPGCAEAYNNLGTALQEQGKLEEAISAYNKALTIRPDYADTCMNMGNVLSQQGKMKEAMEAYNKAIEIEPGNPRVYFNIGNTFNHQHKQVEAIEAYKRAISIKPDYADAYYNLSIILTKIKFTKPNTGIQKLIGSLLDNKNYVRPIDISAASISLLKFEPVIEKLLLIHSPNQLKKSLKVTITEISRISLLLKLMSVCPLPDLKLERGLTYIRSALLFYIAKFRSSPNTLIFQSALALQCFTNEYIYEQSIGENKAIKVLEASVKKMLLNGSQPNPQSLLCLASYKALHEYEWCDLLKVNAEIEDVYTRQVTEPKKEVCLKSDILTAEEVTNEVSSRVKEQYEINPYPRWVDLALPLAPIKISKLAEDIKLMLFDDNISEIDAPHILIAGCGTGQHSIGTAARFKGSEVLAIDLSLSSLAYAKRKTNELGVKNIKYMQADILNLSNHDRKFDIVESVGVLHHMKDPMAGWKILADCLKMGGLMKIGLYSKIARQHILAVRKEITLSNIELNNAAMKSFRSNVLNSVKESDRRVTSWADFYSMSEFRDLIFHVQEHQFTLPQIKDCISNLGLKFCGFESVTITQNFRLTNTDPDDLYDLDKWNAHEHDNPHTFQSMYQFWCQKLV